MRNLAGKSVWITGASSGIGAALAHAFAVRGARLVLSARREARLREVAKSAGAGDALLLPLDITDPQAVEARVQEALAQTGGIDVMIHNAGVGQRGAAADTALAVDRHLMDVNYFGPLMLTKTLLPSMRARKQGQFIVMSSVLGIFSAKHRTGYAAAKHALHGFFDGLRAELADEGIGVLLVCPGHVHTEFSEQALEFDGRPHAVVDESSRNGLSPEACASRVLRAYDAGEQEIVVARWEHWAVALSRLAPGAYRAAVARQKVR
jgi:dehydrogenase/reductase SDR family protein 7B